MRLILVDDHPSFAKGLRALIASLTDDMEVVGVATTATEGLGLIRRLLPDVAVLDLRLPDGSGIDMTREIRGSTPSVKVVILTASDEPGDLVAAGDAGALAFLSKEMGTENLIGALRLVHEEGSLLSLSRSVALPHERELEKTRLSASDRALLEMVAQGEENSKIAKQLCISESTLKRRLHALQQRFGVQNRVQAAVYASRHGLI